MAVASAPESFHSVTLSVDGHAYTANIWRGGHSQWRLLSVDLSGERFVQMEKRDYESCHAVLEAAELVARTFADQLLQLKKTEGAA